MKSANYRMFATFWDNPRFVCSQLGSDTQIHGNAWRRTVLKTVLGTDLDVDS